MSVLTVEKTNRLEGSVRIPGDKSISHRSVMFGSLAKGRTLVANFLQSADCLHTIECFRKLGITISVNDQQVVVDGQGLGGLQEPNDILDVGNSGTTMRLISGVLSGCSFTSVLTGDPSIRKRPMKRVTEPLQKMGATILGREEANYAPLAISGGNLKAIKYDSPIASAQVKSAILLAGLFADGWTEVNEPQKSRNHTELMFKGFGVEVEQKELSVRVKGHPEMIGCNIRVPGDISSAAFLLVAGAIVPEAKILLKNVGLNPTRTGIIDVLKEMGAKLHIDNQQLSAGEPYGDITIETSELRGITIRGDIIPRLIDEVPVIAVAAACADGITEIRDAEELKVKESNRIATVVEELSKFGVDIEELPDGLRIRGGKSLTGTVCNSHGDHRIALALAVAGLVAAGETSVNDAESINVSFPNFTKSLQNLGCKVGLA